MAVKFIRIDDRLIHGQVVTAWIKVFGAKRIVIIDDDVAKDDFLISVLKMVKPSGIDLIIRSTEGLEELIEKIDGSDDNVIILMKSPATAEKVFNTPINLKELNVGGLGANAKRKNVYKNVSASEEELDTLKAIQNSGVRVYFQATPNDRQVDLKEV